MADKIPDIRRWNGNTKLSKEIAFTIHYADGTSVDVKDGVLFTVNDNNTMDIHIGVKEHWKLFGVYFCFMEFITVNNLIESFRKYIYHFMKGTDNGKSDT